ncbi:MAG: V-type ATPase subunit [Candidatus Paceibacterota bacterium]
MSDYIYAGTKIKALEKHLLTHNQVDMLLSAKSYDEALQNLHDTFVGPYLAQNREEPLPYILEMIIADTKKMIVSIAPEPEFLKILWLKYDFYNLAAIIKGFRMGLGIEDLKGRCFIIGNYSPSEITEAYQNKTLGRMEFMFKKGADEAASANEISDIDRIMNITYLKTAKRIATESDNDFLNDYVKLLIDFFNIQANLRALSYGQITETPRPVYVRGGTVPRSATDNKETLLASISKLGSTHLWEEAVKDYKETGSYAMIETAFDNRINSFVREKSMEIFSIASLFAYFRAVNNNVHIIRTILVGKRSELPEYELRKTIRQRYG